VNILGRSGFGPVYRGEWNGQVVAIKKLDQARALLVIFISISPKQDACLY
jgi:hypothetical protein